MLCLKHYINVGKSKYLSPSRLGIESIFVQCVLVKVLPKAESDSLKIIKLFKK